MPGTGACAPRLPPAPRPGTRTGRGPFVPGSRRKREQKLLPKGPSVPRGAAGGRCGGEAGAAGRAGGRGAEPPRGLRGAPPWGRGLHRGCTGTQARRGARRGPHRGLCHGPAATGIAGGWRRSVELEVSTMAKVCTVALQRSPWPWALLWPRGPHRDLEVFTITETFAAVFTVALKHLPCSWSLLWPERHCESLRCSTRPRLWPSP